MAQITVPKDLRGKALHKYLIENKSELISQKKTVWEKGFHAHKKCEPIAGIPSYYFIKGETAEKALVGEVPPDANSLLVKVVGNAAWWCDSAMDVLIDDCWKKSIAEQQGKMHHVHDHVFEIAAKIGQVRRVYSQDISLTDLGLNKSGKTQCIIWETDVLKSYNPMIFEEYRKGLINQHSISLNYVKMELAINDEEYEKEIDFWNKYYPNVINPEVVDEAGFFWVIQEIKVIENSCVLLGANALTPTLSVSAKFDTGIQPARTTEEQPLADTGDHEFDFMKAIREKTFIN